MTAGKLIGGGIVALALVAGVAIYYLQLFHFYDELDPAEVTILLTAPDGSTTTVPVADLQAIDASSSPLRFRACFTLAEEAATFEGRFERASEPVPLTAPGWFECYDAEIIGEALETGAAMAYLGQREIADGVDRIVAVFPDGRAFAWHQLNEKYAE